MSNLHDGHVVRPGLENHGRRQDAWKTCEQGRTTIFGYFSSPGAVDGVVDAEASGVDDEDAPWEADVGLSKFIDVSRSHC